MPNKLMSTLVATCAVAILGGLAGALPASAAAQRSVPVDVRALTSDGEVLAEHRQYTRPVSVPTSPRADCFGTGTGGSGEPARVPGQTALGALAQAARYSPGLRPLLITDSFDFGLGICGIGGPTPDGTFWYVKADHANPGVAADQAEVRPGGSVLWYLCEETETFTCGSELELRAPARAQVDRPFRVRVIGYDDAGEAHLVEGAHVSGADAPTNARGIAEVTLPRSARLRAVKPGDIPSAARRVCVSRELRACPPVRGLRILGSDGGDRIKATLGPDAIRTGPGNNAVNVRGGWGRDRVLCGRGRSLVLADSRDVVRGCSVVLRR